VLTAVRGPVVGPACRACASESERGWGRQGGASASFIDEVRRFARWKNISAGTVCDDPDLWRGGCHHICTMGYFKVNGVGILWLTGNDEVMAKKVGAVIIIWELWRGAVTREASIERGDVIFVIGASMRMLVTEGNECINARQEYKIVGLVVT
jgi:hypothetical protein